MGYISPQICVCTHILITLTVEKGINSKALVLLHGWITALHTHAFESASNLVFKANMTFCFNVQGLRLMTAVNHKVLIIIMLVSFAYYISNGFMGSAPLAVACH